MFEYIAVDNKKVTINPKMITMIRECDAPNETLIYTADGPDPIRVQETYEKVSKSFQRFNYSLHTVINV